MKVVIIATKNCNHRPILEEHLKQLSVSFDTRFFDDEPELVKKYNLHHSPNLVLNDKVVFHAEPNKSLPSDSELRRILDI